jgi:integrase/recombinase XerD
MSTLTQRLNEYLAVRRSLGFDLSHSASVLRRFTAFADREETNHITVDVFLRWKAAYGKADNNTWSARLGMVRVFARWLQALDARTEVPPAGLIAGKLRRGRPYIYSDMEITAIVVHAARLRSRYDLRGWTCSTLFGLIAVTGLRINEALQLDDDDVDIDAGVITVRRGKNGRARFVPIAASAIDRLRIYRHERMRLLGVSAGAFFRNDDGQRLSAGSARYNFAVVSQAAGLRELQRFGRNGRGPRIHDLRHTHAVRTIMGWYRNGLDPDREMSKLSTYLGHARPEATYWYIEAVPELLRLASERAERAMRRDSSQGARPR